LQRTAGQRHSQPNIQTLNPDAHAQEPDTETLQDIVTASPNFDVDDFVPQLREFLAVHDMKQCMFLLRWITLLVR